MHDFLKLHHNCDAYMAVQKERKSTFLTAFEQREKEARSLFAAQYWYRSCLRMSLSSESSVSNTIPRYLYWSTDFTYWPPNFNNGAVVLFALLALNVIQTVLLQSKIISCDFAYAWHTSSILCNQRTPGQNTNIISMGDGRIFSRGGLVGDFPKIFQREAKSGEIWFLPLEI